MKKIFSLVIALCLIANGVKAMDKENTLYLTIFNKLVKKKACYQASLNYKNINTTTNV